jgi:hypothetical protein
MGPEKYREMSMCAVLANKSATTKIATKVIARKCMEASRGWNHASLVTPPGIDNGGIAVAEAELPTGAPDIGGDAATRVGTPPARQYPGMDVHMGPTFAYFRYGEV